MSKPSDNFQVFRMSFTWNKPADMVEVEFTDLHKTVTPTIELSYPLTKIIFQLERGTESQRLHFQGHLKFKTKHRVTEVAKKLQVHFKGIHLSADSDRGSTNAEFYCMKHDETWVMGPWHDSNWEAEDWSYLSKPNGWQLPVARMLQGSPERRIIYWIWEETGNTGKSEFATYMEVHHNITGLGLSTALDNFYAVSAITDNGGKRPNGYIFDVPRTLPKRFDWAEVYMSMEKIKDGNFLSTKYVPKKVLYSKTPHMVVFSNQAPDIQAMSIDRWRIYKVCNNTLVGHNNISKEHILQFNTPEPEPEPEANGAPKQARLQDSTNSDEEDETDLC